MQRIERKPRSVRRYREIGGVLDFAFFEDVGDAVQVARAAIGQALERAVAGRGRLDPAPLRSVSPRALSRDAFLGDWFDGRSGLLVHHGDFTIDIGERLANPTCRQLEGVRLRSGGAPIPALWAGGQFAYAFSQPPYGLQASPGEIQALFEKVCDLILPPSLHSETLDWGSPALMDVSDYFLAGDEWWGVFLFTVRIPATRGMTVILGSTTD